MNIFEPHFTNEDKAREKLESIRWPEGPFCPHCGSFNATRLQGKKARPGVVQCNDCRQQFTVTVGTVFERSKVPLHKWLLCNHLLVSSKKGMSAHQIGRILGVTYKTAWFMCHRIREAMRSTDNGPMGGGGGVVEADETYIGKKPGEEKPRGGFRAKLRVIALVDRNTGISRSIHADRLVGGEIASIVRANVDRETRLVTDEARHYIRVGKEFTSHESVLHAGGEYVRGDVHTNTVEGFFSIFKRGMRGVYQHCGDKHLHRYLSEFDFRYSHRIANGFNDTMRAEEALKGIYGRRLTYRRACIAA